MKDDIMTIVADNLGVCKSAISVDAELGTEMGIDSLTLICIITDIEEKFDIVIGIEDMLTMVTIDEAVKTVTRLSWKNSGVG